MSLTAFTDDRGPRVRLSLIAAILIGTIPVPHSKDKRSPAARQDKRSLVRQGATIFKEGNYSLVPNIPSNDVD
jgi:hypothetical protein